MTEYDLILARRFKFCGGDPDYWYFTTPSWTRAGVEHDLWVDRRNGEIGCWCEDARCRDKRGHVLDHTPTGCKHEKALAKMLRREE